MDSVKLNNGLEMPILGLGTWQGPPGKEHEVGDAVKIAIDLGYRHFDCAHVYRNQQIIGSALQEKFKEGKVKREDLFIVSKLWNTFHNPIYVEQAIRKTLEEFQLEYLDLYLIHWPMGFKYGEELFPTEPDLESDYLYTWKAMEKLVEKGLTKSIGVSNFNSDQVQRVIKNSNTVPVVNQVECHPYLNQAKLSKFCRDRGVQITAYSPLGSPTRPWAKPEDPDVLSDERISKIAQKHGKTPGQVLLRFQIQLGHIVIPKSSNPERLKQNIDIFNFKLSDEEMDYINTFNRKDGRVCQFLMGTTHKYYPFAAEF